MRRIDELFLECPFYGARQMMRALRREGYAVGRCRMRRLMALMGLRASYRKPRTSDPHPAHKVYPCRLRDLKVMRANQVWCTDITYIPMNKGFLYLMTVMDWHSRKIFSWRLSNTMDTAFCLEALEEALARYGPPEIFNSDQGSQFTSIEFTQVLKNHGVRISMDGRGRWRDNVFIERFWRSLKYD
jgi:putative transposase